MSNHVWSTREFNQLAIGELYEIIRLRQDVFIVEQQCCYQDLDDEDQRAIHMLARGRDGCLAGYQRIFLPGVLREEAMLGRIIVAPASRGTGLGRTLVRRGIDFVREHQPNAIIRIAAQAHLERFYAQSGFVLISEAYPVDGIPHVDMILDAEAD